MTADVFDNLAVPLLILSGAWAVEEANDAFLELTGYARETILEVPAGEIFGEVLSVDSDSPWNISHLLAASGERLRVAFRVQELPGERWLLQIVPSSDGRAISEAFRHESQGQGNGTAEQLVLLGHLAGGIAHDLNNILTGVLGHLSLLRSELGEGNSSLALAEDGARKACSTAQQVLDFVRGSEATREVVDLGETARNVASLLRIGFPKDIELRTEINSAPLLGNEGELSQLVMNLAINARDAISRGGHVTIRVGVEHDEGAVLLEVEDSGDGIPVEFQKKIFEPFFTTKAEGTGLGLPNVKRIVERFGGSLHFQSTLGQGTIFQVRFPLVDIDEIPKQEPVPQRGGAERILVVEDEETVRLVMRRSLEHLGYVVDVAEHGLEAVQIFEANPFAYQLVVVDVMMPKMPGDELFGKLRELNPAIPVLIASGYASDNRTRKMLEAGRCGYIQKPFGVEDLAAEVRRCIDEFSSRE